MNFAILHELSAKPLLLTLDTLTRVLPCVVWEVVRTSDQLVGEAGSADRAHEETEDEQQTIMEATDVSKSVPPVVADSTLHDLARIDAEIDPVAPGVRSRRILSVRGIVKPGVEDFEVVPVHRLLVVRVVEVIVHHEIIGLE